MLAAILYLALAVALLGIVMACRRYGTASGLCSFLTYFIFIWTICFPARAFLIHYWTIPTQAVGAWSENELALAMLCAIVSLGLIIVGFMAVPTLTSPPSPPSSGHDENDQLIRQRLLAFLTLASVVALGFALSLVWKDGTWVYWKSTGLIEQRVGAGPLFLLAELPSFGVFLLAAHFSSVRQLRLGPCSLAVGALLISSALVVSSAMATRRPIAYICLAAFLVLAIRKQWAKPLLALAMVATLLASPILHMFRYACIPCLFNQAVEFRADKGASLESILVEVEKDLATRLEGVKSKEELTPEDYKKISRVGERWASIRSTLGMKTSQEDVSSLRESLEKPLSPPQKDAADFLAKVLEDSSKNPRTLEQPKGLRDIFMDLGLVGMSSSFEGVDHVATFLQRATAWELTLGVDQGESWAYNAILSLIPRRIWPAKPLIYGSVAQQKFLYPYMFNIDRPQTTLPVSYVVDFLFGFGIVSFALLSVLLGRLLALTQEWTFSLGNGILLRLIGIYIFMNMFNVIRGGTGVAQGMIMMLVIALPVIGFQSYISLAQSVIQFLNQRLRQTLLRHP
jgi:hypothetical protein